MTCGQVRNLLDPFVDGELAPDDSHTVALHLDACSACGDISEQTRHLRALVAVTVEDSASGVDFGSFWPGVARQLETQKKGWAASWRERIAGYWWGASWGSRLTLAGAATAAIAVVAFGLFAYTSPVSQPSPLHQRIASVGGAVRVSQVRARAGTVAVWREPIYDTTVIWVAADGGRR